MDQRRAPPHFNLRSLSIGLVSLALLAIWSHWHGVICVNRTALSENSPPVGGVGVFLGVLLIAGLLELVSRRWRLPRGELIVVYAMLMVAAPWMGHGIWYRFVGLIFTIPRDDNQASLFHEYSDKLWPHGPQLVHNGTFLADPPLAGYHVDIAPTKDDEPATASLPDPARVSVDELPDNPQGLRRCVTLRTVEDELVLLKYRIPRVRDGRALLVPGENYHLSYLARLDGARGSTLLNCYLLTDKDDQCNVNTLNRDTKVSFSAPIAFTQVCYSKTIIPDRLDEYLDIVFEFRGAGRVSITDVRLYNNEAIHSLNQGRTEVRQGDLAKLPPNQRARVDVRPDRLWSPAGILYRLRGQIPLEPWARPAVLWGALIMAVFVALLALMVILRRQWADHERFSFPMLILPRAMLEEDTDPEGRPFHGLFRKRVMWIGFGISVAIVLTQGLHHYFRVPTLRTEVDLTKFFENNRPLLSFFRGFYWHPFSLSLLVLPIAFFIELELLGSILLCFLICQLPYYLREDLIPSWKSIPDFPFVREQHTGAYVAVALITLYAARRHLRQVFVQAVRGRRDGEEPEDGQEAWSYRAMLITLLACLVFLCGWTQYVGVAWWKGLVYFAFILVCGLSTARIRAECGTPWTYITPYTPLMIFAALGGSYAFGTDMMVIMIVSGGFMCAASYLMCAPTQVEMLQLGRLFHVDPRAVAKGMAVGALGGMLFGGWYLLSIGYSQGGMNVPYISDWVANQAFMVQDVTRDVALHDQRYQKSQDDGTPFGGFHDQPRLWALGGSFVATIVLFIAKTAWVGFPLHPVGYVLANTYFINMVWGSLLVAMLVKFFTLRAGGVMTVRRTMTPFFVGMFLGAVCSYMLWDLVGLVVQACGYTDTFCVPPMF